MSEQLMMKYFVLKPKGNDLFAKASRQAMLKYASVIRDEHPEFAAQIREWVGEEAKAVLAQEGVEQS